MRSPICLPWRRCKYQETVFLSSKNIWLCLSDWLSFALWFLLLLFFFFFSPIRLQPSKLKLHPQAASWCFHAPEEPTCPVSSHHVLRFHAPCSHFMYSFHQSLNATNIHVVKTTFLYGRSLIFSRDLGINFIPKLKGGHLEGLGRLSVL